MNDSLQVKIHPDCPNENPIMPPAKSGDVGYDLKVWIRDEYLQLNPGSMNNVRTGVYIKLPDGCWGNIRPRSSTFAKKGLFIMGGTLDNGYTGEISIFIWNPNHNAEMIVNGERLAQLIICPIIVPSIKLVKELPNTERGSSGFGSTGFNNA